MIRTKKGAAFGALAALTVMVGASAFVPAASGTLQPPAGTGDMPGLTELLRAGADRPGVERNCTVTDRNVTDADGDGNAEYTFIAAACREAADLNHNGTMDAWRHIEANFTRVDRNDDGHPELVEAFVDAQTTADRNEDGTVDAERADHIHVKVVDNDSDGAPDLVMKEYAARFAVDRDFDGTKEVSGFANATLTAADTLGRPALDVFEFSSAGRLARFGNNSTDTPVEAAGYEVTARAADRDGDGKVDAKRVEASRYGMRDRNADGNPELAVREHLEAGAGDRNSDGAFDVFALNLTRSFASDRNSDGNPEYQVRTGLTVLAADRDFDGDIDFAKASGFKVVLADPDSDGVIDREARSSWERMFSGFDPDRRGDASDLAQQPARESDEPTDVTDQLPPLDEAPADR